SFFVTCVPIVVRYSSSNMLIVYRRINDVFPTALSPTRQTFDFNCFCFVIRRPRPEPRPDFDAVYLTIRALFSRLIHVDSRRDRDALSLEDHGPEPTEEDLHILPRFRRGVEVRRLERPHGLLDLLVAVQDHDFVFQIDLVDRIDDRDLADETDLRLDALGLGHRGRRRIPIGLLKGSAGCPLRKEPFSSILLLGATMRLDQRLILALDLTDPKRAVELAGSVRSHVDAVKVGWPLVLAGGLDVLRTLAKSGYVLCDFKIADIPNTNRLIVEQAVDAGASGVICHGFVGEDSVR